MIRRTVKPTNRVVVKLTILGGIPRRTVYRFCRRFVLSSIFSLSSFAQEMDRQYDFDIDESTLAEVLDAVVEQTDALVLYPPELADATGMQPISGRYSISQALEIILSDTKFSGGLTERGVIFISQEEREVSAESEQSMNKRSGFIAAVIGLFASTGGGQPAVAQEGEADVMEGRITMENIFVTARKREESLQDVPVSISVLSSTLIEDAALKDTRDFFEMTPGIDFDIEHDRMLAQPAVRGVQNDNSATVRQKVGSFIDGMPMIGTMGTIGFTGLERIEVMRGPQSAAFGRAVFAGAINYVTADPTETFEGKLDGSVSSLGRNQLSLEMSGPITDTLGYAIAGQVDSYDGEDDWVTTEGFDVGGHSTQFISAKLKYTPNDRFSAEFMLRHSKADDDTPLRYFIDEDEFFSCSNFTLPNGRPYIRGNFNCDPSVPDIGITTNSDTVSPFLDETIYSDADRATAAIYRYEPYSESDRTRFQGELTYSHDRGDLQLLFYKSDEQYGRWYDRDRSDTPVQIIPGTGTVAPGFRNVVAIHAPTPIDDQYIELRWVSEPTDRYSWTLGASYFDYDFATLLYSRYAVALDGGVPFPFASIAENSKNSGLFANISYDLTNSTTLSLEARYQSEEIGNLDPRNGRFVSNTESQFLPRIALTHELSDDLTIYAQYSRGANPAGVNLNTANPDVIASHAQVYDLGLIDFTLEDISSYPAEETTSIEFGVKGSVLDNRLQFSASYYQMDWDHYNQGDGYTWDLQDLWDDSGRPGAPPPYVAPAQQYGVGGAFDRGSVELKGIEAEALYVIDDSWDVSGTIALTSSEFQAFCDPQAVTNFGYAATHEPGDRPDVTTSCVDVSGNSLIRQPDIAYTLATTYRTELADSGWGMAVRMDYRVVGENYIDTMNIASLPESATLNGNVTFTNEDWSVKLWGRNLTDDDTPRVAEWASDYNINVNGSVRSFSVLPREGTELGATLSYSF